MGQRQLRAVDGFTFGVYEALPDGEPKGGVVVIQEIFGVNGHIREVADGFARAGYAALAPQIFDRVERDVELAVKVMLEQMTACLAGGGRIEIRGFGSFTLRFRPARTGRNPNTGTSVSLPARYAPHFKPGIGSQRPVDVVGQVRRARCVDVGLHRHKQRFGCARHAARAGTHGP